MKSYPIKITETLSRVVHIKAGSEEQAQIKASQGYFLGKYALHPDHYQGVEFEPTREAA